MKLFIRLIATALGSGYSPKAPGTAGTLVAVPLAFVLREQSLEIKTLIWVLVFALGTWAATRFGEESGRADDQRIVIDEVVGYGITSVTLTEGWLGFGAAFVAFRFFDITKLPPIRQIDLWSKKQSGAWARGFGVMIDDVLAGFQGLLVILVLKHFGVLS